MTSNDGKAFTTPTPINHDLHFQCTLASSEKLHNTYTGKRPTKDEMVEACHINAIKKAMKQMVAKRQAMESEDSV